MTYTLLVTVTLSAYSAREAAERIAQTFKAATAAEITLLDSEVIDSAMDDGDEF